jgi:hypothetical protein
MKRYEMPFSGIMEQFPKGKFVNLFQFSEIKGNLDSVKYNFWKTKG